LRIGDVLQPSAILELQTRLEQTLRQRTSSVRVPQPVRWQRETKDKSYGEVG